MPVRKRRRYDRKAFDRLAVVDVGEGGASTQCEILNISDGGARLRPIMCTPHMLPDKFILLLTGCGKVRRACRVAWRSQWDIGVEFRRR